MKTEEQEYRDRMEIHTVIREKGIKGLYMNKDNIKNSALHDYELKKLEISYEHKCVLMHLISPTGIHDVLEMPHFKKYLEEIIT